VPSDSAERAQYRQPLRAASSPKCGIRGGRDAGREEVNRRDVGRFGSSAPGRQKLADFLRISVDFGGDFSYRLRRS
jgi:hypothetical protein